jgi:hypothetical protein
LTTPAVPKPLPRIVTRFPAEEVGRGTGAGTRAVTAKVEADEVLGLKAATSVGTKFAVWV